MTRRSPANAQTELMNEEGLAGVPTLVYANKQDLLNAMTAGAPVEEASLRAGGPPSSCSPLHTEPLSTQAADLMQELELTTYKDRWIHVEVSAQPHTSTNCRLVAAYGRHLGFALFCQALTAQPARTPLCTGVLGQDGRGSRGWDAEAHGAEGQAIRGLAASRGLPLLAATSSCNLIVLLSAFSASAHPPPDRSFHSPPRSPSLPR